MKKPKSKSGEMVPKSTPANASQPIPAAATPPARRSLRLAGASPSSAPPAASDEKSGVGRGKRRKSDARSPEMSMDLRSGTKIAKARVRASEEDELYSVAWPSESTTGKEEEESRKLGQKMEEKRKGKLVIEESADAERSTAVNLQFRVGSDNGKGKGVMVEDDEEEEVYEEEEEDEEVMEMKEENVVSSARAWIREGMIRRQENRRTGDRNRALNLAPKFAVVKAEKSDSDDGDEDEEEKEGEVGRWPGPFSTAKQLIEEREEKRRKREEDSSSKKDGDGSDAGVHWVPKSSRKEKPLGRSAPSLRDLCMKVLSENAEHIESLDGVPDMLKSQLVSILCRSRKMGPHFFLNLVSNVPTELCVSDCSWATEEQFEAALAACNTEKLAVVQLDLSGRCLPDYVLRASLARLPNCLPSLTSISLKGNYRLSDDGINAIIASAPSLRSMNLSQCSLITSAAVIALADNLGTVLRELYLDNCQDLDPMTALPALIKLKALEILSVSGIESVSNKFVKKLVADSGSKFKELSFANCRKLTAASLKAIGENCPRLCALDLSNVNRLSDPAICHIGNGCRSLQKLKLRRNKFSDEAVAAFVELAGDSLTELTLNSIEKVGNHTTLAISSRCSSTLEFLDLSFCRNVTDEGLGLIADNCSKLKILKLFGCTQITDVFLEGHSNPLVKVIGLKGSILEGLE